MTQLSASGLSHAYGKRQILHDVGFDPLPEGGLVALIGPNAAGKSTLFRVIAGLVRPKAGTVLLGDQNLAELSTKERMRKVCFMPQYYASTAALSVFDVVLMAHKQLSGWRVSSDDRFAVAEMLETAGISHLAEACVADLSGGQAQMVSVCQALIRQAHVYLFDEPTSALDLRHQLEVLQQIRSAMKARGTTGIVALHDLNLAARFADHLILIGNGKILAEGPPDDVLRRAVIGETYGVGIDIITGPKESLHVSAYL